MDDRPTEGSNEWTQEQVDALQEMAIDYIHSRWFWKRAKWWLVWTLGLPSGVLMVWEPVARLGKLLKGLFVVGSG